MVSLRVGDEVYGLEDESSSELVRRLGPGEPERGSLLEKLREGLDSQEPVDLDSTEIVIVGIVLEAWLVEADGDLPGDVQELRLGISAAVRDAT